MFMNSALKNNKPILLVGNSPNVKDHRLGTFIDPKHFNIIRFNKQPISGYEAYVGRHTTYRVVNGGLWMLENNAIPTDHILIAEPKQSLLTFQQILRKVPTKPFHSVHIVPDYTGDYNTKIWPTSGLIMISYFLRFYKRIYIYGFSFDNTHYFEQNKGCTAHNYEAERQIVSRLQQEGKVIYLTDQVHLPEIKK